MIQKEFHLESLIETDKNYFTLKGVPKMKKRLTSLLLAFVMCIAVCLPVNAAEAEPNSSRFTYYTETDPNWTLASSFTVTAEESKRYQDMEDVIWGVLGKIAGRSIEKTDNVTDVVSTFVRENNIDNVDAGTYIFSYKNKIRYKKHLGTGQVYVDLRQQIVEINFSSTEKCNIREITYTLR